MEAFGHRVEVVENGADAVTAHERGNFDLILMDVRMPEMSGPDATRVIRQLPAGKVKIPIIAVTADALNNHIQGYFEAGMDECVAKPIDRTKLLEAINKVLGEEIHVRVEVERRDTNGEEARETSDTDLDGADEKLDANVEDFLKQLQELTDKYSEGN